MNPRLYIGTPYYNHPSLTQHSVREQEVWQICYEEYQSILESDSDEGGKQLNQLLEDTETKLEKLETL